MSRDWMKRLRESMVVGVGSSVYTLVDEPLKKAVSSVSPQLGGYIPTDSMDGVSAFVMGTFSSFIALTAYDYLLPSQLKKII